MATTDHINEEELKIAVSEQEERLESRRENSYQKSRVLKSIQT